MYNIKIVRGLSLSLIIAVLVLFTIQTALAYEDISPGDRSAVTVDQAGYDAVTSNFKVYAEHAVIRAPIEVERVRTFRATAVLAAEVKHAMGGPTAELSGYLPQLMKPNIGSISV